MSRGNYTPSERVIHKLLGAAYQATFDQEYKQAVRMAYEAIEYAEGSDLLPDDPAEAEEIVVGDGGAIATQSLQFSDGGQLSERGEQADAEPEEPTVSTPTFPDGDDLPEPGSLKIPRPGSNRRDVVVALLNAHKDGAEWADIATIRDYKGQKAAEAMNSKFLHGYDYLEKRTGEGGGAAFYRIRPRTRRPLIQALYETEADGQ